MRFKRVANASFVDVYTKPDALLRLLRMLLAKLVEDVCGVKSSVVANLARDNF
eukprot:CAMPEP_0171465110 /NCGR_PEP_ID=MMETSP0945-20130129/8246_1 /TAXON_ID=109269 /ORGANISM="Vaucheria litorea, Strain CCMP2940" /LENGTH=52 /DNA_ID=CAMNT_0011992505 /DNA_START=201 /DNA_END=359 /DNA_ORIENTATION=+